MKKLLAFAFSFLADKLIGRIRISKGTRRLFEQLHFFSQSTFDALKKALFFLFVSLSGWHRQILLMIFIVGPLSMLGYKPNGNSLDVEYIDCPDGYAFMVKPHIYVRCEDLDAYYDQNEPTHLEIHYEKTR